MDEKARWDAGAKDFQQDFALGMNEYNAALLGFWQENGMIRPGCRVLDIGCGVGKYGSYLAELGCDVTLTDISDEMLRHAEQNMAKHSAPWTVYQCDFNKATGLEPAFAGGFDLVISTMSPAVKDEETVRKMSGMSRGWCFLAHFYDWEQQFRDQIMSQIGLEPPRISPKLRSDCASMIQAVSKAGYVPQVKYVDYNWSDNRSPEQMADYLRRRYYAEDTDAGEKYAEALRLTRALADHEGFVCDSVNTKVAWIWWKCQ